jgi:hypothetical protein
MRGQRPSTTPGSFGEPRIYVHELDGEEHVEEVEPDFTAPTPADIKGPHAEP